MNLEIYNARLIDPTSGLNELSVLCIKDGKILSVGEKPYDFYPDKSIDAKQQWLFPGLVDLAAYLRDPGLDYKASIGSETKAAQKAGITTLCFLPEPCVLVDTPANVNLINEINQRTHYAHVKVIGNLTYGLKGKQLSKMGGLKKAGCVGLSNGLQPIKNLGIMRKAMEYAANYDFTVFVHPFEHSLAQEGCVHEGKVSARLGLPSIPIAAETAAIYQILALVKHTGCKTHFCRLSSEEGVNLIRKAKSENLQITADVAAHQLFLTELDISDFNPLFHVLPPLRTERDKNALREGIRDGTIDVICSDHQPHEVDAKLAPFQATEPGISALETLLPLSLKLVNESLIPLTQVLKCLTINPAKILNLKTARLEKDYPADINLFDPDQEWQLRKDNIISEGKNTPFINWGFQGKITKTYFY